MLQVLPYGPLGYSRPVIQPQAKPRMMPAMRKNTPGSMARSLSNGIESAAFLEPGGPNARDLAGSELVEGGLVLDVEVVQQGRRHQPYPAPERLGLLHRHQVAGDGGR